MKLKKLVWKKGEHGSERAYVGGIRLFSIDFSLLRPKGEKGDEYILRSMLPQVKTTEHPSYDAAKSKAEEIYQKFFEMFQEEGGG